LWLPWASVSTIDPARRHSGYTILMQRQFSDAPPAGCGVRGLQTAEIFTAP